MLHYIQQPTYPPIIFTHLKNAHFYICFFSCSILLLSNKNVKIERVVIVEHKKSNSNNNENCITHFAHNMCDTLPYKKRPYVEQIKFYVISFSFFLFSTNNMLNVFDLIETEIYTLRILYAICSTLLCTI